MLKPNKADYTKANGSLNEHAYKRSMKIYQKHKRSIKKEALKDELVKMVQSEPAAYLDFALPIFRIGLDSYSIQELKSFL